MTPPASPKTLTRVISLILSYSLVLPYFVLATGTAVVSAASPTVPPVKMENTLLKATRTAQQARWRDGELLVRFRQNASAPEIADLLQATGAQLAGPLRGQSGIERLQLMAGLDPLTVATTLQANRLVDFAEPNYLINAHQSTPDDPRFSEQWALRNTGTAGGHHGADINATQSWELNTGSRRTVIAVIDSGVDFNHPDLHSNQWNKLSEQANNLDDDNDGFADDLHGWDFLSNSSDTKDAHGHGTSVAGIIAARANNTIGIAGVMWRASLMSLRVLDETGVGDISRAVEAIDYAVRNGAQVINCSWGTSDASIALREAISRASRYGVVVVASAGNSSQDVDTTQHYPASFDLDNLITVASTDNSDLLAAWSNWGATRAAVAAPGTDILTTKMGGDYHLISGTSASAPFVTGIAGLIKTLRPWLGAERTRDLIVRGSRQVSSLAEKVASKGVVNAGGALHALKALPPAEGRDNNNGNNGGEHDDNRSANQEGNNRRAGNNGNRDGREFRVTPPEPTRGVPLTGLPDLDNQRRKQPANSKAPDSVPSTRCSHQDPQCDKDKDKDKAAIDSPVGLLAWGLKLPSTELFAVNDSRPVSDTPFQLFRSSLPGLAIAFPQPQASNSATYVRTDAATQGNWKGAYGADGYHVVNDTVSYPAYAQVTLNNHLTTTWVASTGDARALQKTASTTDRLAACWYQSSHFNIDVNISDGGTHQVALYALDWDGNNGRAEQIDILDAATNAVLDSRSVSAFSGGKYLVWNVSGHVIIRVTRTGIWNSVVSGLFFDSVRTNVALSSNGGAASASSQYNSNFPASAAINGDRYHLYQPDNRYNEWHSATPTFPQWLQVSFNGSKTIDEIDVVTQQDDYNNPVNPTETTTFQSYGLTAFEVQYWDGAVWTTVPGGNVTANNKVLRKFTFSPVTTTKVRVLISATADGYSRVMELEAWGADAATNPSDFALTRLDSYNRTGGSGVDLLSRNANWSVPLLGLKGRAGLDLSLALSYNSLVWTKSQNGTSIKFDADAGTPSPGFRLGFPVVQAPYYNAQTGKNSYLLITPSGSRIELRQLGSSNVYEAADSSYLQLIDNGSGSLTLRPTDGSQLSYVLYNGQYQCAQIKDRNGNYISISHHTDGRINTITDTLARVINFNYDGYLNLVSITQNWGGTTHTWATFGWSNQTINTSFNGLTVIGPQHNASIPVLTSVGLSDGTYYKFRYTAWGQIDKVTLYAGDSQLNGQMLDTHPLNYTLYTHTPPASSNDCPRVTEQKVWAENWNNNLEATTSYSTASDYSSGQMVAPDGTIYKELYGTSGWQKGLTTGTEFKSDPSTVKKSTITVWTQDDTNLLSQKNPRVIEVNVFDSEGNQKKTTIDYGPAAYAQYGLPYAVREYSNDGTTILRVTFTDYNLAPDYVNRRIIGLVSAVHVSDGTWQSKTGYEYDAGGDQLQTTPTATVQHDASYGTNLTTGRGNLTLVSRYDIYDIGNESLKLVSRTGYDINGSVIFTRDHLGHQTNINYQDSFSDGINNRNTYAYPTKVTPPLETGENAENFSTTTQYNYFFGAVTRTQAPAPAGQTQGAVQTFEYDASARLTRINNVNNGAYKRWVYDPSGHVSAFGIVQTGLPEGYSITVFDGMGRVRAVGGDNPNSTGGYRGQFMLYDVMGRASQASNPTEMTSGWAPAGDDAGGWYWTTQQYNWQGKPTVTINPDGTTKEAIYDGCGCAGGEVVILRDEIGRRQKITSDILSRASKKEILNWDQTVYSTTINTYNARNQLTSSKQYQGTEASGNYQETILTYDGYGRLKTRKSPAQMAPTTYSYNADDIRNVVTDARGATTTFSHNSRHQVTSITYDSPEGVATTADVNFSYDAAGNRTGMTDELGNVTYQYDQISRLTSETRNFTGVGSFTLGYTYNLTGQVASITDSFGAQINYAYDKIGQLSSVTGSGFGDVSQFASGMQYRAWGSLKRFSFGNNNQHAVSLNYTARKQVSRYQVDYTTALTTTHRADYQYLPDGRLSYSSELENPDQDRSYTYDQAGRLTLALTGAEARGEGGVNTDYVPFRQSFGYDVWNNMTSRTGQHWGHAAAPHTATYVNDRNQNSQWQYDESGNLRQQNMPQGTRLYSYDAVGRQVTMSEPSRRPNEAGLTMTQSYDGDGQPIKRTQTRASSSTVGYQVRSSVLGGQVIMEVNGQGQKTMTSIYANGMLLARTGSDNQVVWVHQAPDGSGEWLSYGGSIIGSLRTVELGPMGDDIGVENPYLMSGASGVGSYPSYGDPTDMTAGCTVDGFGVPCRYAYKIVGWRGAGSTQVSFYFHPGLGGSNHPEFIPTKEGVKSRFGEYDDESYEHDDPRIRRTPWGAEVFTHSGYFLFQQANQRREDRLIDETRNNLIAILNSNQGNNDCARFFGGAQNAIAALNAIPFRPGNIANFRTGISMTIPTGPVPANATHIVPNTATVNNNGGFYRSFAGAVPTPNFGGYGSNNNRSRAVQMLHELGHVIVTGRNPDGTPQLLLPIDGQNVDPTGDISRRNTQTVVNACRNEINSIRN